MNLLPLDRLGAKELSPGIIHFGILLPWISSETGIRIWVKIIHENDQFLQDIKPLMFELTHSIDNSYGDYWSADVKISQSDRLLPRSSWGADGRYIYRYYLETNNGEKKIDWIIDAFAREFGVGKMSAFTLGYDRNQKYSWSDKELNWKTPNLNDIILYELMINEFGGSIDGTVEKFNYLNDLGINCIEIMPITNVSEILDWGFLPIGYFGSDERFGKRRDFQKFVDEAHQKGIAVVLDMVYGHTSEDFMYNYVYKELGFNKNPFMGPFSKDYFGESTDFNNEFTRDFFFTVSNYWLEHYHIDGFRFDCVPNYYDGPTGNGYASLTYNIYQLIKSKRNTQDYWQRFFDNENINIIQCAEELECPKEILEKTYSNCTWQNDTLEAAYEIADNNNDSKNAITNLGFRLGLIDYKETSTCNEDTIKKSVLQYIETHDHYRFLCRLGLIDKDNELLKEGNRDLWYKLQPYFISMFAAKGIPMLWQGQEFGEKYYVPDQGWGRVCLFRPVRWDLFYDNIGQSIIELIRKLIKLRINNSQFRNGDHYFYNDFNEYQSKNVMIFSRKNDTKFSLIAINFGNEDQKIHFTFPYSGNYHEELHGLENANLNLNNINSNNEVLLDIPSNYGRIWSIDI